MSLFDEQIEAVTAILRVNGSILGVETDAPEFVKRTFFEMMVNDPVYRKAAMRGV